MAVCLEESLSKKRTKCDRGQLYMSVLGRSLFYRRVLYKEIDDCGIKKSLENGKENSFYIKHVLHHKKGYLLHCVCTQRYTNVHECNASFTEVLNFR